MKQLLIIFLCLSSWVLIAQCPPILDQSHTVSSSGGADSDHRQTFVAGMSGDLSKIHIIANGWANLTVTMSIYEGNVSSGTLLYQGDFPFNQTGVAPELVFEIPCSEMPVVTAGNTYTIRLQGGLDVLFNHLNTYTSGYYENSSGVVLSGNADICFKTFVSDVDKPEFINMSITHPSCFGYNDGEAWPQVNGGVSPYAFNWSDGNTSANNYNLTAGTYTVTATDLNGCVSCVDTAILIDPTQVVVDPGPDQTICENDFVTINTTTNTAINFSWSPTSGLSSSTAQSPAAAPTSTTNYTVVGTDANGCSGTNSVMINVNPLPTVNAGPDVTMCEGTDLALTASGTASTYTWSGGVTDGVSFVPPLGSTTYTVTGIDGSTSCQNTDQIIVNVNPIPNVVGGSDVSSCEGTSVTLTATGASTYNWDNGISNGVAFVPGVGTTTYIVEGVSAEGCSGFDTVLVTVFPLPNVNGGPDQTVCDYDLVTLNASGADSCFWSNNVTNGVPFIPTIGTEQYIVVGTDINGCEGKDTVFVTTNESPTVTATNDLLFCLGDSIHLSASGADAYDWNNGAGQSGDFILTPLSSTVVEVVGTTQGCSDTATVTLTMDDPSVISAGEDVTICSGFNVTLMAHGGESYSWSGPGIVEENGDEILIQADTTAYYTVEVTTTNGCVYSDSVLVTANEDPSCEVKAFNAFSPNGDAINEYWEIHGIESFPENHVTVYNRWGDLVFEANNYDNENVVWKGNYPSGKRAPAGTYFYLIEFPNAPTTKGWVQLMK